MRENQIRVLNSHDVHSLQSLFDRSADFAMLTEGAPFSPTAAAQEFVSLPDGRVLDDKRILGIFDGQVLLAVLESVRHHREDTMWWIGLLLVDEQHRLCGLGRRLVDEVAREALNTGFGSLGLSVAARNTQAINFWTHLGFIHVDTTAPRRSGVIDQPFLVFERRLT